MNVWLVILCVVYFMIFFVGIIAGAAKVDKAIVHMKLWELPAEKIFFTFGGGLMLGYWLFGGYSKNKHAIEEAYILHTANSRIQQLTYELDDCKRQLSDAQAEIEIFINSGK